MRFLIFAILIVLSPMLAVADLRWHKFGRSGSGKDTFTLGRISVTIQTREVGNADFQEDCLEMKVRVPGQKTNEYWFTSSYGFGEVALHENLLLLKYGVGRGTWARVDHVRALRLHSLEELVDVQSSYYILTNRQNTAPDLFEYRLKIQAERDYTTLSFSLPKRQRGFPSEKIVKVRNDDKPASRGSRR